MKKTVRIVVATLVTSAIFAAFFAGCGDAGSGIGGRVDSIQIVPISLGVTQGGTVILDVIVEGERLGASVPLRADVFVLEDNEDASGNRRIGNRTLAGVILSGTEALPYGQDRFRTRLTLKLPPEADPDYDITVIVHTAARGAVNAGGRTAPIGISERDGRVRSVQITGSGNAHRDSNRVPNPSPFAVTVNWDDSPTSGVSNPNAVWWSIVGGAAHDGGPYRYVATINAETGALTIPRGQRPGYLTIRAISRYGHEYYEINTFLVNTPEVTGIAITAPPASVQRGDGANLTAAFSGVGYPQDLARPSDITWSVAGTRESSVTPTAADNLSARLDVSRWERLNSVRVWVMDETTGSMLSASADIGIEGAIATVGAFIEVAAGDFHVLARDWDNGLWAWGRNNFGQLGLGDTTNRNSPQQVGAGTDWIQVTGGQYHTLGIRQGGTLWAWGAGARGALGLGRNSDGLGPAGDTLTVAGWVQGDPANLVLQSPNRPPDVHSPTQIMIPNEQWQYVTTGASHGIAATFGTISAARTVDGRIFTWGTNMWRQLGNYSTTGFASLPIVWPAPTRADRGSLSQGGWGGLATGRPGSAAAISAAGHLYTWGSTTHGEAGQGQANAQVLAPGRVNHQLGTPWASVSAGLNFMIAVDANGVMWSWGSNAYGNLGIGIVGGNRSTPVRVIFPGGEDPRFTQVSISQGTQHVLAIDRDHRLWAWGLNTNGQIGNGSTANVSTPVQIMAGSGAGQITQWRSANAGSNFSVAVSRHSNPDHDGVIFTWGNNQFGQMGNPALTANVFSTPQRLDIQL